MKLDILNPYVVKIIISARKEDSIRAISRRIDLSYGWAYKWVLELEKEGVFLREGKKVFLNEKSDFYRKILRSVKNTFGDDVGFHYQVLSLFGINYCFTGIDAIFIWTDFGYNISRYKGYYPIFIKVKKEDEKVFEHYIKKLNLKGKIFYRPEFLEGFTVSFHNEIPVDSLEETIGFMKKYIYNFQPALEMVQEMYGKKLE